VKDNTLDMFPEIASLSERVKRVQRALKAIRRIWGVTVTWPMLDSQMLMDALKEQMVQQPESLPYDTNATHPD
jgi:hypothetical protein